MFDNPVNSAGHLGGDCGIRLSAQMCVVAVVGDVTLELIPESVGARQDGKLACHPQG